MKNENNIRNFRNSVQINFAIHGDSFSLKVPHYQKWLGIIKLLSNRGFIIGENPSYKEHYKCLSKYHKIGHKKDIACLMEIRGAAIEVQFGNIKNLWTGIAQNFWDNPTDDRYAKLTYLENVAVKFEIFKLIQHCKKWGFSVLVEDRDREPEDFIIHKLKVNTHIHGIVNNLNDIKLSIKEYSYDYLQNSNDKNKKKIICGEVKYFYSYYTNRLCCGVVWHNINNMWWVICGKDLCNVASFELFDFDNSLPRRKPINERELEKLMKKLEAKKDYYRCMCIEKRKQPVAA